MKTKTVLDPRRNVRIPVEIAALGAGRDAYLRDLIATCECGTEYRVGHGSGNAEFCERCNEQAEDENMVSDGNMTEAEFSAKWG